jgi:cytidyltransferase-like protein
MENIMKVVVATGGFDPIHSGHIEYLTAARALGDMLLVGVNSDEWLVRKKGKAFMPLFERLKIVANLHMVDAVMSFSDDDGTAIEALESVKGRHPDCEIIFANGGDRTAENIPEMVVEGVEFVFGVGGENKANSSSWILEEWKAPKTDRPWGYYRVLHEVPGTKVKELTVNPGQKLSMQRHRNRSEYWQVTEGQAVVQSQMNNGYNMPAKTLSTHESFTIPKGEWHQLSNPFGVLCKLVEIQFGEACDESDIERKD